MAIPVNQSQQVRVGGWIPISAYSRVIVVRAAANGGGVWGFGYSPQFGGESRMLSIRAIVQLVPGGALERSYFSIHQGGVEPQRYQDVQAWDRVIDFGTYAGVHGMIVYGQSIQFSWNLTRVFRGGANRFGVLYYNASTNTGVIHVFFEMTEG